MVLRFLGESVTDSNGLAVLPDGYTGTGAGEIDVVAKTEIDDRILQSAPYTVYDCYKYDKGILNDPDTHDIWTLVGMSLDRGAEYSTLTETASSNQMATITNIPYTDYHVEVDLYLVDGDATNNAVVILNSDYSNVEWINATRGEWKHISKDYNDLATNTRVRLITGGNSTELRFKNFKLYPI